MQITCTSTPDGNVYHFYRTEQHVYGTLRPIIPFLIESRADMEVGRANDDPALLLRVGPVHGQVEAALLRLIGPYISAHCPAVPA